MVQYSFWLYLANVFTRDGIILSTHESSLSQPVNLRFWGSIWQALAVAPAPIHALRTVATGFVMFLKGPTLVPLASAPAEVWALLQNVWRAYPVRYTFRNGIPRYLRNDGCSWRTFSNVGWWWVVMLCLQKDVFVETQTPKVNGQHTDIDMAQRISWWLQKVEGTS